MEILFFKYAHVLCLVYWLGGDLGTFIASRSVVNPALSAEARVVATKILLACDQGPRFAMPLILPTGLQMAWLMGILPVSTLVMGAVWGVALIWLAIIIALHFYHGAATKLITRMDWILRISVCVVTITAGLASIIQLTPLTADWAGYKLTLFGCTVLMGLIVRVKLKPFFPVYGKLLSNQVDAQVNATIRSAINGTVPFVATIWVLLFVIAAFGLHLLP